MTSQIEKQVNEALDQAAEGPNQRQLAGFDRQAEQRSKARSEARLGFKRRYVENDIKFVRAMAAGSTGKIVDPNLTYEKLVAAYGEYPDAFFVDADKSAMTQQEQVTKHAHAIAKEMFGGSVEYTDEPDKHDKKHEAWAQFKEYGIGQEVATGAKSLKAQMARAKATLKARMAENA